MKYKIILDSSSDMNIDFIKDEEVGFEIVPLTIRVKDKDFVDDDKLEIDKMLEEMHSYNGKSTSSCPSPYKYIEACSGEYNFIITISSKLSGSYNSACLASNMIKDKKVFVIDSKLTSGAMILIAKKVYSLIKEEKDYQSICQEIEKYRDERNLLFVLDSFDNLIKNGRMSKLAASMAKLLMIKPLCKGEEGEIKIFKKVRTRKLLIIKLISEIKEKVGNGYLDKECIITHCFDSETGLLIKNALKGYFKEVILLPMKGLCSFYALEKGIIVSF